MESNSIYNHTSDLQNRVTAKQESEQFQTEVDDTNSRLQLTKNLPSVIRLHEKKTTKKKKQLTRRNERQQRAQMTRTVQLHCTQFGLLITKHVRGFCYNFNFMIYTYK